MTLYMAPVGLFPMDEELMENVDPNSALQLTIDERFTAIQKQISILQQAITHTLDSSIVTHNEVVDLEHWVSELDLNLERLNRVMRSTETRTQTQ